MTNRYRGAFFLTLFVLCVVLAGRNDMLRDEKKTAAAEREARADMIARAAEDKCGDLVAVKRRDGWACVPLKRSM